MHAILRLATPADGPSLAAIYAPSVTDAATSFELEPPPAEEMARRVSATLPRTPWLVLERAGTLLGYAYASMHRDRAAYAWSVDVSVYVGADHRGAGVGRRLYDALLAIVRAQGFYVAHAGITLPNAASVRLHESVGFRPVGVYPCVGYKHGAWRDVGWWRLALRPCAGHPEPTRDVTEALRDVALG